MADIFRKIEENILETLKIGKSVLLLGPRQTGKTTLIGHFSTDFTLNFIKPAIRLRYEREPQLLTAEIESLKTRINRIPLVVLDEVQRAPHILDIAQDLIDRKVAQFIITGSSARKLRRNNNINLLPGRVFSFRLDPFSIEEKSDLPLEHQLIFGSLPEITLIPSESNKEKLLETYVETYLEEEVRTEALVRQIAPFARFLELAAIEAGNIINLSSISKEIGVATSTIANYLEILEDCLIVERINPITQSTTRKRLTKSPRYLFFDLGVRRVCARFGQQLPRETMGNIFEQFIGIELIRKTRLLGRQAQVMFWKDYDGPEIDWVVEVKGKFIPIEIKYKDNPSIKDTKHLQTFLSEYKNSEKAYIVCQTPNRYAITNRIEAVPWQEIPNIF